MKTPPKSNKWARRDYPPLPHDTTPEERREIFIGLGIVFILVLLAAGFLTWIDGFLLRGVFEK